MEPRFQEPPEWPPFWPALVRCPRCAGCAVADRLEGYACRVACPACALTREGDFGGIGDGSLLLVEGRDGLRWWKVRHVQKRPWPHRQRREYVLWLRAGCCGGRTLWAFNADHLDYLERFVEARMRERGAGRSKSAGLSWRLPGWMKEAGNREEVLRQLAQLRTSLAGTPRVATHGSGWRSGTSTPQ